MHAEQVVINHVVAKAYWLISDHRLARVHTLAVLTEAK